jgi:UDP-2,4-diacetamido-2,4,6-trideoxy-beta-L-altropyranose hydrolase
MKVVIRADASPAIGSGHVMRCLALADELAAQGALVTFVSRPLPSHLEDAITAAGHRLRRLRITARPGLEAPQVALPQAQQEEDALSTIAVLDETRSDWLVVDHYGLDSHWETAMRARATRLMAIDDLARRHVCDLVLDANVQPPTDARYADAGGARLLLGPAFALLRPQFAQAHPGAVGRRGSVRRLMIFLGGMDNGNATGQVLKALEMLAPPLPPLDVVIGALHPARDDIEAYCRAAPGRRCHVQVEDMAGLLLQTDLAVGAGGGATWERCCLGVPTLALALADNQRVLLEGAAQAGLVCVPDGGLPAPRMLAAHLEAILHNTALRESLSRAGMSAVDGRGAKRVAAAMAVADLKVRPAAAPDRDRMHAWRNAPSVRAASMDVSEIVLAEHRRWFDRVLSSPDRVLLVGEDSTGAVGVVRFDLRGNEAEVSIYVVEPRLGQGLGGALLRAAEDWLARHKPGVAVLHARTLPHNAASRRLFEQAGYRHAAQQFIKRFEQA